MSHRRPDEEAGEEEGEEEEDLQAAGGADVGEEADNGDGAQDADYYVGQEEEDYLEEMRAYRVDNPEAPGPKPNFQRDRFFPFQADFHELPVPEALRQNAISLSEAISRLHFPADLQPLIGKTPNFGPPTERVGAKKRTVTPDHGGGGGGGGEEGWGR